MDKNIYAHVLKYLILSTSTKFGRFWSIPIFQKGPNYLKKSLLFIVCNSYINEVFKRLIDGQKPALSLNLL